MATKEKATCSTCGKEAPMIDMHVNKIFEEERCRECMQRYGDVPLETLRAALSHQNMDIIKLSKEDRDALIELQIKKTAMNRDTEKRLAEFGDLDKRLADIKAGADRRISELEKALFVFSRAKKIQRVREEVDGERINTIRQFEGIREEAKEKRAAINKEIDNKITVIKAIMEAGQRKPQET